MTTLVPPPPLPVEPTPALAGSQFITATKKITNPSELQAFHRSAGFRSLIGYIQKLCEAAEGKANIHEGGSDVCLFIFLIPISHKTKLNLNYY